MESGYLSAEIAAAIRALRPHSVAALSELATDLTSCWSPGAVDEVAGWMSRPAVLRRVAAALAERVPPETDRLIASGPGALVLGAAVSLGTGLPFAALGEGARWGDVHAGEQLFAVAAVSSGLVRGPHGAIAVLIDDGSDSADALFRRGANGLEPQLEDAGRAEHEQLSSLVNGMIAHAGTEDMWLETAASPARLARLGERIARVVGTFGAEAVVHWRDDDEAALAQAVAQALAVPVARADLDLGLLTLSPALPDSARNVLLLASSWNGYRPVAPLVGLLRGTGREPVAALSLFSSGPILDSADGVPAIVIAGSR